MPEPVESLPVLEQRLVGRLLAFERLDNARPRGRTALERAEIGRLRSIALLDVETLQQRILRARAATLDDAAVLLRRLAALADADEAPNPRGLFAEPDVRRLVASVLAVVEREADAADRGETEELNGQRFNGAGQPG